MATSIQAPQRMQKPAASPSDSFSNTTTTANSAQIKRVLKLTVRSASSYTNKVSSSDQNGHLPSYHKPTKRSPPQNPKAVVSSGPTREGTTRTARRTSMSPGAKTAASPSAKPGQERASKASKPGKMHQLYVKKTTLLSNGKETHDPAASTEISKDVAVDPVSHADNLKTKQEETIVKETKKVEPVEEEVTIPTETVSETEKLLVDVSVSEGNEEERKKLQISDISTVSEEEENQSPSAVAPSESLEEKEDEEEHDGNSAMRIEKDKKEGEELEETKEGDENEKVRVEEQEEEEHGNSTDDGQERNGEEEKMKMVKLGSSGGGKGKKESPPAFNEVIEETASKLLEERKNKVKAFVGTFETVIDYESSSK